MFNRQKAGNARRAPIARHPAFGAIITAWLAALMGLGTFVWSGKVLAALAAAILGGLVGWFGARFISRNAGSQSSRSERENTSENSETCEPEESVVPLFESETETENAVDSPDLPEMPDDRPAFIEVNELGLASLDADIESETDLDDFSWQTSASVGAVEWPEHVEEISNNEPVAWVEAETELTEQPVVADPDPVELSIEACDPDSAAKVLRSQKIEDMSLVQMIERFALALDEQRELRAANGSAIARDLPDPALVEALRTLPLINKNRGLQYATDGNAALDISVAAQADETEAALREALEKLQRMSGGV